MTIANAIDRINDKLAGSDQPAVSTIEDALGLLADNIPQGGWGGSIAPATADTLGGVKIGEGIDVTQDGTISAGGGYDLVIELNEVGLDAVTTATIVSGTFAACKSKSLNGETFASTVYGIIREDGVITDMSTFTPFLAGYATDDDVVFLTISSVSHAAEISVTAEGAEYALVE